MGISHPPWVLHVLSMVLFICMPSFITADEDLGDILVFLLSVLGKWRDLGAKMGVRQGKLAEIDADYGHRVRECMRNVLLEWLHGNAKIPVTWQGLIGVLRDTLVEEVSVANEIIEKVRLHVDIN